MAGRERQTLVRLLACGSVAALAVGATSAALVAALSDQSRSPAIHAERSGLRFGTQALSGRVSLVSSVPAVRWRIVGRTPWRPVRGRTLVRGWATSELPDGPYRLKLETDAGTTEHWLFIRNHTYLPPSLEANDAFALDVRLTDARSVVAAFRRRSYAPGEYAVLDLWVTYPEVVVEVLHVGPERMLTVGNETIEGVRVAGPFRIRGRSTARLHIGEWPSGLYATRLTSGERTGFAPFIVRPRTLGQNAVAVIQPTNTWQAYNYRCDDGDGKPDTWYHNASCRTIRVDRPFLQQGVPPHFRQYDVTFLRWLDRTGRRVDMLAQEDVERLSGDELARLYRLIVFPGHHEYVTQDEYDRIQRFRDLGGNLAFLSANNFFWRVNRHGNRITRVGLWRDLGRPEAALVGTQYFDWNRGTHGSRPFVVRGSRGVPWLFAGTGLDDGESFGMFGIEVDHRTTASPRSTITVAEITRVFGSERSAEMTYYRATSGARVFAAGAFTFSGTQLRCPSVARVLDNLWNEFTGAPPRAGALPYLGRCPLVRE